MCIGSVRIEAEGHCADLPRDATGFNRPDEPHCDIGLPPAERNTLCLRGKREPNIGILCPEARQMLCQKMCDEHWRRAKCDSAKKRGMSGFRQTSDAMGRSL